MPRLRDHWGELIDRLGLNLSAPVNYLTARQIHLHLGVEPRLLASMDSSSKLPERLRSEGVFVVPLTRSRYALVRGKGYHELEDPGEPERYAARLPISLTTLAYGRGENRFLLHAYHIGLLSRFTEVPSFYQTVSGKMGTGSFSYHVDGSPELEVKSAGMELDAGFEGPRDVLLFEGKATARTDFLVRQLYYPYRTFRKWSPHKRIRSFFFVAEPETTTYALWEYEWINPTDYETIRCVRKARFRVETAESEDDRLDAIEPDPAVDIVPQADDLQKVAELPLLVDSGISSAQAWAGHYGITPRQGSYYREAAEALGLVRLEGGQFTLTDEGRRYVGLAQDRREKFVAERLLKNPLLNHVFHLVRTAGTNGLGDAEVARIIEERSHLRGSTPLRRAKSVRSYMRWLGQATGAVVVDGQRMFGREGWDLRLSKN
jgi:hypothetical protein